MGYFLWKKSCLKFICVFVKVKICHKSLEENENDSNHCRLTEMPNWAFSYALGLYRKSHWEDDSNEEDVGKKAERALDDALRKYPFVPRMLLEKNNVNLRARSFKTDWPSVMPSLDSMNRNMNAAVEKIASIFVDRHCKIWSGDDVVLWLYNGCQRIVADNENEDALKDHFPSSCLIRYMEFDSTDFQNSFHRIPVEANPLDPGLMEAAFHYIPNRRRFLRMNRRQGGRGDDDRLDLEMVGRQQPQTLLGTGRNGMGVIDPDLPLLELFWRSLLPWVRVEGVPPAR